jgi:hypothetical protein
MESAYLNTTRRIGLVAIKEADELVDDALGAALTALGESGQIEIREMRLPAEVTVFCWAITSSGPTSLLP